MAWVSLCAVIGCRCLGIEERSPRRWCSSLGYASYAASVSTEQSGSRPGTVVNKR
jgi:hypothetical protein